MRSTHTYGKALPPPLACGLVLAAGLTMLAGSPSQAAEYAVIAKSIEVNRSADAVWSRIGDYCAISVWMKVSCSYASGSGDVGTVRLLMDGATVEPMVAKTAHSYTYWQSKGTMAGAEFHGTLAVEPEGRTKSRLSYTLFYDPSALASDAVRQAQHDRLDKRFGGLLEVMKTLSEAK